MDKKLQANKNHNIVTTDITDQLKKDILNEKILLKTHESRPFIYIAKYADGKEFYIKGSDIIRIFREENVVEEE